jgi:hypothetical protein
MSKGTLGSRTRRKDVMELEEFVRTALQSIIRGMKDLGKEGYTAEGLSIRGREARIDFKVSLEAVEDGKIRVAKIDGKANPNSNRIEFSIKISRDPQIAIVTR